jgi:Pirin C-terminal cupin domain
VNCPRRISRLDQGELITIPPLPDAADWQAFVMNTQAEIRQTIEDYRQGRMGAINS